MSCGVGCRCGLVPALLCLWSRPAVTAPIRPLAWEPPYATDAALEKTKKKREREQQEVYLEMTMCALRKLDGAHFRLLLLTVCGLER